MCTTGHAHQQGSGSIWGSKIGVRVLFGMKVWQTKVSIKPTATSVGGQGAAKRQRLAEN